MSIERIGRYEILETLGRGAMGVVYLARDPIIDRRLALKTLRVDLDADYADEFRERFIREARAAGRLNHPGIVTIHDVGEDPESGLIFIAMEYIEGKDLKHILSTGYRFRPSEAARIAADVATALDYAHSMGVVHRDIKPANIILTQDGTAKITDFGVARLEASNLTVDGQFIGTPNFMSPEQVTGKKVDGRSDLFSLGVVLYTLLTNSRPFSGETMHQVTLRIVQEPCPIPSTVSDDVPAALNPIVLKCLEKNPDRRFQTGNELARVLAALARSLVAREPEDSGRTEIFQPDLATRIRAPAAERIATSSPRTAAIPQPQRPSLLKRLPLPEWVHWEVEGRWSRMIVIGLAAVCVLTIAILRLRVDTGPFTAPAAATAGALNATVAFVQSAGDRLARGDLPGAKVAILAALHQAPASPAARRAAASIREQVERERTSAENQRRVAELVTEGRELYRAGRYSNARSQFEQALELDPLNEIAASYLELAEERSRGTRPRTTRAVTTRAPTGSRAAAAMPVMPSPTPGVARITLYFDSPINSGSVQVAVDGSVVLEEPFDFTKKGFLGFRKKGRGTIKRVLLVPSGNRTVTINLSDHARGTVGSSTFVKTLAAGSDWTLRIDLPDAEAEPNFYMVKTSH